MAENTDSESLQINNNDCGNKECDLKSVKLVIWDLDETFWSGTLSENDSVVIPNSKNIELIKRLTDKGIVNSICSKNDINFVNKELNKPQYGGIDKYFVFSSINWESKGKRIKSIIDNMNLRSVNVLFIDDNVSNLKEAEFYCPRIKTALPCVVDDLLKKIEDIKSSDLEHKRLKQYKILEQKVSEKKNFSSNDIFLLQSNIKVEFHRDCTEQFERILELINRTNQLNYTKLRLNNDELQTLLDNKDFENGYVTVSDRYGDYGICGFYSVNIKENKLIHFLFSCRIMSMGVEQYVWDCLNYPELEPIGEIAQKLEKNKKCNWINQKAVNNVKTKDKLQKKIECRVLIKGTCDMRRTVSYIKPAFENLKTEISSIDDEGKDTANAQRVINIVNSHKLSKETKEEILKDSEFVTKTIYDTTIFKEKYDVIVYSLLLDTRTKLYIHKNTGQAVGWWFTSDFTDEKNKKSYLNMNQYDLGSFVFTESILKRVSDKFVYKDYMTPEQVIENVEYMINNVKPDTKWIFLLGSLIEPSEEQMKTYGFRYRYERNCVCNEKIISYLKNKKNVKYICYSDIIKSNEEYTCNLDHFTLEVYKRLANEIIDKICILTNYKCNKLKCFFKKLSRTLKYLKRYFIN